MYFILFILSLLILALYFKPMIISFQFNTDKDFLNLYFYWLYPLFKAKVEIVNLSPILSIYFFGIRFYSKPIKQKKQKSQVNLKAFVLNNTFSCQ